MPRAKQPEGHPQELHTVIVTLTEGSLESLERVSKHPDRGRDVTRVVIFTGHVPTPQQKKFIFSDDPLKMLNGALGRLNNCTTVHMTDSSEMLQQGSFCFEQGKRPTRGQLGNQPVHDNKTNTGHDKRFLHRAVTLMMSAAAGCSGISTIQIAIGSIESLCPLTSDALQLVRQQKGRSEEAFGAITSLSLKLDSEEPSKSSHLQSFLGHFTNLLHLEIEFIDADDHRMLRGLKQFRPRGLRTLTIIGANTKLSTLSAILRNHWTTLEGVTLKEVQLPSWRNWDYLRRLHGNYRSNCAVEMEWCMSEDGDRPFRRTIPRKQILAG